jgi:hypothetical protein
MRNKMELNHLFGEVVYLRYERELSMEAEKYADI